ncbi:uncharacterized protein RJT21DRAFT_113232 [Scheffersomyces amazonensis]|uniref:uncharacterized protein n=1 Tax=Scheffersomyces amazonensis TaxID=1078765 RepID=UPI00315C60DB
MVGHARNLTLIESTNQAMSLIKLSSSVRQLESDVEYDSDTDSYMETECKCASCEYISHNNTRAIRLLKWGLICPLIWLWALYIMLLGLYFKDHSVISSNSYIQVFKLRIFQIESERDESEGFESHTKELEYHTRLRGKFITLIGYTLVAIAIYSIIIVLLVFAIILLPYHNKYSEVIQ